jgi:2,4-diaminopentanoate dehydrogenase
MSPERYRVVQWATGHTGMRSLENIIEHPRLELVGLFVYSDEKVGRDAGDICGTGTTGVVATRNIDDVIALEPDCVVYMPLLDHESIDDMCRLLASGANIVTPVPNYYHPPSMDPAVRERLEAACRQGGSSLYCSGPGPGFIMLDLPLTLALMERRLDRLSIVQYADLSERQSPAFLPTVFGMAPEDSSETRPATRLGWADADCLKQFAAATGLQVDEFTRTVEYAVTTTDLELSAASFKKGTVAAWRIKMTGLRDGKPLLEFLRHLYVTTDLDPAWELRPGGWRVILEGDAPLDVTVDFERDDYGGVSAGYNAHIVVNAVPAVSDAPPGIRTTDELRLVPYFGRAVTQEIA